MTSPIASVRTHAPRLVVAVVVTAMASTLVALALKSWCGIPGSGHDLYLRWCYSDIPPLWFAERLNEGAIPYLDHPVEYPVLTGLWMWLAALPASTAGTFLFWTGVLLVGCAGATAGVLAREVGPARTLVFAAAPTLLVSGAVNWDLPAVLLATVGLVAHRRARDELAGLALGLGTAAKLFPGILLVPATLAAWRLRGARAGLTTALTALVAWWVVNVPVALAAPESWLRFFELSRERPSDWDALTTVASHVLGWDPSIPALNLVTGVAFVVGAVAILALAVRWDPPATWHLAALPLLAWFLLTSKVYSPQFSLWLLPLFALAFPGWGWLAAFAVADLAVTATRFPYLGNFIEGGLDGSLSWGPYGTALVVRAVVLAGAAWVGWRRATTSVASKATPGSSGVEPRRDGGGG